MRYGIITHYDVHNHGAVLQLNALCKVLRYKFNIEATALRFDKNYDFMGRELKAKYEISLRSIGVYMKYWNERGFSCMCYNFKKRQTLDRFKSIHKLIGDYYTESGDLDGVVVGSDEVFALHTGPTPAFFGHALPSKKVFAYAGSFGPTTIEDVERLHCRAFVSSGLQNMAGLAVRDQNSIRIGLELTGKEVELVCDPVILYGYEQEIANFKSLNLPPYLLVYAYDQNMNDQQVVEKIKAYACRKNLKIVSAGFYHSWVDMNINADPVELLRYFKYATCVVTDTFHGAVMSIITGRDMAVYLRSNVNKLMNLLQEYELERCVLSESWNLEEIFRVTVNQVTVRAEILHRRNLSMDYLTRMVKQ